MIHGLRVRVAHLLHRDVGCAVANLAARDVSVLDDDDGMLGMLGSHVVTTTSQLLPNWAAMPLAICRRVSSFDASIVYLLPYAVFTFTSYHR